MAKHNKAVSTAFAPSKSTFAASLQKIGYRFSLSKVFSDFLTMTIAACTQNLHTKLCWYEEEYLQTVSYYKDSELRQEFPKAFASLIIEMEERVGTATGNDVLGDFFELNISHGRNGQFFTPYPVCMLIASSVHSGRIAESETTLEKPLKVLDPACGSGRMLLAAHTVLGIGHEYYGIDIDRICVQMTAINLFFNGMWNSEVMCADALNPDDFVVSYRISLFPLGIFKIEEKEKSKLWHLHRNSFNRIEKERASTSIVLNPTPFKERPDDTGTQLNLF